MATTLLLLAIFFLFHLSSASQDSSTQLLLQLTHRLSHSESSTHNLLKSSSLRSSTRFRTRQHRGQNKHNQQQQQQVSVPLSAGSDYTLTLSLSKNNSVTLYMDTGSDLVWFPCSPFQCMLCEGKTPSELTTDTITTQTQTPTNSKPVHCSDLSCSAAHSSLPSSDLCAISGCPLDALETSSCPSQSRCPRFYYAYGDGSLIATLRRGPVHLANSHPVSLPNFTFACAHSALAEPVGVAGFGRGLLSLPNQLSPSSLGSRFSYCLLSHSFRSQRLLQPSPLILGRSSASLTDDFVYTPILPNPKHSYLYSVGLAAISVGPVVIPANSNLMAVDSNGDGGLAVDSGTTFTMLPSKLYSKLASEFGKQMKRAGFAKRAAEAETETGLSPCYYYSGSRNESSKVPSVSLHFLGNVNGNSSSSVVELPRRNYFLGFEESGSKGKKRRVGCLMVMDGGDDDTTTGGGPAGTLGNFQQQGFEVVYDLEEDRVGFARRRCSALWDQMSRD